MTNERDFTSSAIYEGQGLMTRWWSKLEGAKPAHLAAETEFGEGETSWIFFSKFSLKDKWNWHLIQFVSYFLELCGISYECLKS